MTYTAYEKDLIERILASIEAHGGGRCLSSVILTGSFARGEATYSADADGILRLESDVEIALVFPRVMQRKRVTALIQAVSGEYTEDLNLIALSERRIRKGCNFNFSLRTPRYKTLFTYDLFNGSKTIWGADLIGGTRIALSDVDPYEAKRLVANRIAELTYLQETTEASEKAFRRMQWKGKLILAIASAWLMEEGQYTSSYHEQRERLMAEAETVEEQVGKGFMAEYEKAFGFLRDRKAPCEAADDVLAAYVSHIDRHFEREELRHPRVNSAGRLLKYALRYAGTGMKYGIVGAENHLLQALISDYEKKPERVNVHAHAWRRVLY